MKLSSRSLVDMPFLVLEKILKDADFRTIASMRKVCSSLRRNTNPVKTVPSTMNVFVNMFAESIFIRLETDTEKVQIEYRKHENGCLVVLNKNEKLLKNENFVKICGNDLGLIFHHKKSISRLDIWFFTDWIVHRNRREEMEISSSMDSITHVLLETLEAHLKARNRPLQVESFKCHRTTTQSHVMKILAYLDPSKLKSITIAGLCISGLNIDVDEIVNSEHFKQAEWIGFKFLVVSVSPKVFINVSRSRFAINSISAEELLELKKLFLQSPSFKKCDFEVMKSSKNEIWKIIKILGEPYEEGNFCKRWVFKHSNPDETLDINLNMVDTKCFRIEKVKTSSVRRVTEPEPPRQ